MCCIWILVEDSSFMVRIITTLIQWVDKSLKTPRSHWLLTKRNQRLLYFLVELSKQDIIVLRLHGLAIIAVGVCLKFDQFPTIAISPTFASPV